MNHLDFSVRQVDSATPHRFAADETTIAVRLRRVRSASRGFGHSRCAVPMSPYFCRQGLLDLYVRPVGVEFFGQDIGSAVRNPAPISIWPQ